MKNVSTQLFGKDERILHSLELANNYAKLETPVLLTGENGTGKRTLCMHIHEKSQRGNGPLLLVDCNENSKTVEDKILGFKNADSGRFNKGVLEKAHNGSVIFANIDSLEEGFQRKLYKILLDLPDYDLNIRILATTSKQLSKLVGIGKFYRALYIYLSGHQIHITPLRERKEDIAYLANMYLERICFEVGKPKREFTQGCIEKLENHYWENNVNELIESLKENIKVVEDTDSKFHSENYILGAKKESVFATSTIDETIQLMSLKDAEKLLIRKALVHTSENRTQAAKILGVSIRTLRNKINEYRTDGSNFFVNLR